MDQGDLKKLYQTVIDLTIANLREDGLKYGATVELLPVLGILKDRWSERLNMNGFENDPTVVAPLPNNLKPNAEVFNSNVTMQNQPQDGDHSCPANTAPESRGTLANSGGLVQGPTGRPVLQSRINVGRSDSEIVPAPTAPKNRQFASPIGNDHANRARIYTEIAFKVESEVSDSSDSEDEDKEPVENLITGGYMTTICRRNDRGGKWRFKVKNGIVSVRDREYPFSEAKCSLEF